MLTHPTLDLLHQLGLNGMAKAFGEIEASAEATTLTHPEWLGLLLDQEVSYRRDRRLLARLRYARLRGFTMPQGRLERLQIMLTDDELAVIDDWRFERRMPSRAAAIRELLKRGLGAEGFALANRDVKSKDFAVVPAKQKIKPGNGSCACSDERPLLNVRHDERTDRAVIAVPDADMAIVILTGLYLLSVEQVTGREVKPAGNCLHQLIAGDGKAIHIAAAG